MTTSTTLVRWCFATVAFASLSVGACGGGSDDDDSSAGKGGADSGSGGSAGSSKGGSTSKAGSTSKGGSSGTSAGDGICQLTCSKACATDNDCETSQGELCCDFGDPGKICLAAAECPRHCEDDSSCSASLGEACLSTNLSTPQECVYAGSGLRTCGGNGDCSSTEVCCGIYNQPICLPAGSCPEACADSADCDTGSGESCCTSVRSVEPNLAAEGLCLNPSYAECPRVCDSSSDCRTANGESCCDGLCAVSCPKSCKQSSDCTSPDARICCTSASAYLPQPTKFFSAGPTCTGSAYSCAMLGSLSTGSCTPATGCSPSSEPCSGTPYTCSYSDSRESECEARPGCEYESSTGYCDGTPEPCAGSETYADCAANAGCMWGTAGTCSGTATPCGALPSGQCFANPGCYVGF